MIEIKIEPDTDNGKTEIKPEIFLDLDGSFEPNGNIINTDGFDQFEMDIGDTKVVKSEVDIENTHVKTEPYSDVDVNREVNIDKQDPDENGKSIKCLNGDFYNDTKYDDFKISSTITLSLGTNTKSNDTENSATSGWKRTKPALRIIGVRTNSTETTKNVKRTRTKRYQCTMCDYSVNGMSNLRRHVKLHNGERPYKCTSCDHSSSTSSDIKRHMLIHSGERRYKCTECDYAATQSGTLKLHMKRHLKEKSHKCDRCDYAGTTPSLLKRHMEKHAADTPHQCPICDCSLMRSSQLQIHMRKHTYKNLLTFKG